MLFGYQGHVRPFFMPVTGCEGREWMLIVSTCSFSTDHLSAHHRPECDLVAGILPIHAAANVPVPAKDGSGFFVPAEGRQR